MLKYYPPNTTWGCRANVVFVVFQPYDKLNLKSQQFSRITSVLVLELACEMKLLDDLPANCWGSVVDTESNPSRQRKSRKPRNSNSSLRMLLGVAAVRAISWMLGLVLDGDRSILDNKRVIPNETWSVLLVQWIRWLLIKSCSLRTRGSGSKAEICTGRGYLRSKKNAGLCMMWLPHVYPRK